MPWMDFGVASGEPGNKTTLRPTRGGTAPSRWTSRRAPDDAGTVAAIGTTLAGTVDDKLCGGGVRV